MAAKKLFKRISIYQWVIIIIFAYMFINEMFVFLSHLLWVIKNNQIFNWQYVYVYIPFVFDPIALYGLYKITKFEKIGFRYFLIGFISTTILDFLRGSNPMYSVITLFGNMVLFLIFHLTTRKIYSASS